MLKSNMFIEVILWNLSASQISVGSSNTRQYAWIVLTMEFGVSHCEKRILNLCVAVVGFSNPLFSFMTVVFMP